MQEFSQSWRRSAVGFMTGAAQAGQKVRSARRAPTPRSTPLIKDGKLVGFDIDIANALCEAAGSSANSSCRTGTA